MSVVQLKNVKLQRADQSVSWGFNIQGGRDINSPLMICKVTPGSLAERCSIKYGDFILKVGNTSAEYLSHASCREVIIGQGNNLEMTLLSGGIPTHEDYASCFRFPPHQQMHQQPAVHLTGSPQVGVQLGANKAILSQSYNSPMGLYSNKNVADTLSSAIRKIQVNDDNYKNQNNNGNAPFTTTENGLRSLSSHNSSLSVSPSSNMMESSSTATTNSSTSKALDSVQLLNDDELNSSPATLTKKQANKLENFKPKLDKFDSLPKPFYLSSQATNENANKSVYEPVKFSPQNGKLLGKNLDFQQVNNDAHMVHKRPSPLAVSPVSTQSSQSAEEDCEAIQKYKQLESKRNSFAKPSLSMDANNNYELNDPEEIEKKKALLKEELGTRLNMNQNENAFNHSRMHKSASIAIDNINYVQLADLQTIMENKSPAVHESPKLPQPTIQSYYQNQLAEDKKHEYKINKLVSPTYKPFSAYSSYLKYTQPNTKSYIAKLDDPSKPSMTQSRSFKLLQETLDNELTENDAVIHDSFSNQVFVKRCSINSNTSPLTQQKAKSIRELDNEAEETYDKLLRNRYQFSNNRAASIAVSSPTQLKNYSNVQSNINKQTPYYLNYKKLIKEEDTKSDVVFRNQSGMSKSISTDFSASSSSSSNDDYEENLKKFREKHFSNYRSNSLVLSNNNKSNINSYLNRKYSSQIEPVSETREEDDSELKQQQQQRNQTTQQAIPTSEF